MEIFLLGVIVGGLVVWGYNKYLNTPLTLDEALIKVEQEAKQEIVKAEAKVEEVVEKVKRPRTKTGTTPQ
jgi:hypothetical protein